MRLVCARSHPSVLPDTDRVLNAPADWLEHLVVEHSPAAVRRWLIDTGYLDAEGEGYVLFWRWDYWNAHLADLYRADDRRRWEAKRAAARSRWGETAG